MVKILKSWTGKKTETNPVKKEQHENRKAKKAILHKLEEQDWKEKVKEFDADQQI